jgi:hypothetical protein
MFKESRFVICASRFLPCLRSTNTSILGLMGRHQTLEGQGLPEDHHESLPEGHCETAGNVKEATLMRDLAFARANPANLISVWNKGSSHPAKLSTLPPWPHEEDDGEEQRWGEGSKSYRLSSRRCDKIAIYDWLMYPQKYETKRSRYTPPPPGLKIIELTYDTADDNSTTHFVKGGGWLNYKLVKPSPAPAYLCSSKNSNVSYRTLICENLCDKFNSENFIKISVPTPPPPGSTLTRNNS